MKKEKEKMYAEEMVNSEKRNNKLTAKKNREKIRVCTCLSL